MSIVEDRNQELGHDFSTILVTSHQSPQVIATLGAIVSRGPVTSSNQQLATNNQQPIPSHHSPFTCAPSRVFKQKIMIKQFILKRTEGYANHWLVFLIDLVLVLQSFVLAYLIRFNFTVKFDVLAMLQVMPVVMIAAIVSFLITKSYRGVIRHTSEHDVKTVLKSVLGLFFILFFGFLLLKQLPINTGLTIPGSILVIHLLINSFSLVFSRFVFKIGYQRITTSASTHKRVLIYGASKSGLVTFDVLVGDITRKVKIIGFIDDNPKIKNKKLKGVPVYAMETITTDFLIEHNIAQVVVASQTISKQRLNALAALTQKAAINILKVPAADMWLEGGFLPSQLKKIEIVDLLERAPIHIQNSNIAAAIYNKIVFVTGAAGSIGSEIVRQLSKYDALKIVLFDQAESALFDLQQELHQQGISNIDYIVTDIRDYYNMSSYFEKYKPALLFHAAAYKHVPLMEENPYEAIRINVMGTKIMADLCMKYKVAKFVLVSTDKAINPTNVMGATKRAAEMYLGSLKNNEVTEFIITRFGNVLGSNGSVIPIFTRQLEAGENLKVTHKDITRYFMTIPEASMLVLEAGSMGKGGQILVFDMGKPVKIFDLAIKMIGLAGLKYPEEVGIDIIGLRPGEKLYEELLSVAENNETSYNAKIMIAKSDDVDRLYYKQQIQALEVALALHNKKELVQLLKNMIPEFISNNSIYEILDVEKRKVSNFV
ncbi:MAG: polysaccharide biosynthesis protein [Labilibaculum sp.]|nr:polysaccharide biosynthesis protein [Labilibaculum sp.]